MPAGQFTMGSSRREVGRRSNEVLRPMRVTRAFYLGAREVTNAEFRAFKPDHDSGAFEGNSLNGDDQPAANVSWEDVAQYLNWLSVKDRLQTGLRARAPPAGWPCGRCATAIVCRPTPNGNGPRGSRARRQRCSIRGARSCRRRIVRAITPTCRRRSSCRRRWSPTMTATPSARRSAAISANAYGIFDLGGNVAEWVQDFYSLDVLESTQRVDDPLGPEDRAIARRARRELAQRDRDGPTRGRTRLRLRGARGRRFSDRAQSAVRRVSCATYRNAS